MERIEHAYSFWERGLLFVALVSDVAERMKKGEKGETLVQNKHVRCNLLASLGLGGRTGASSNISH